MIQIITQLNNFFTKKPEIVVKRTNRVDPSINDISLVKQPPNPLDNKEVFHVPGNSFTYHDAKAVCKAFDSQLASYTHC